MSEPQYFRVNVTSTTSPPKYDVYGHRLGEVEMQLPNNILSCADKVESARMAVMKLEAPLANIPVLQLPVAINQQPSENRALLLSATVAVVPGKIYNNVFSISPDNETNRIFSPNADLVATNLEVWPRNYHIESSAPITEYHLGYHEFTKMHEFCSVLNEAIYTNLRANLTHPTSENNSIPTCHFYVNSDNTISVKEIISGTANSFVLSGLPYAEHDNFSSKLEPVLAYYKRVGGGNTSIVCSRRSTAVIAVDASIANILPSLPWIKIYNPVDMSTGNRRHLECFGDFFYVLNTSYAKVNFQQCNVMYRSGTGTGIPPDNFPASYGSEIEYNFVESDAVTSSNINSIVLKMDGANLNEQVFPVNISRITMNSAQTTTVPIIQVYYPAWNKPSDLTGDLIVSKDVFSSAAPININPQMLKERSLRFKLYYITSKGEMREVCITETTPFCFQLCFELKMRD